MIRFIHTADIHYGMENYGRIDPITGIHSRLLDFDKAFNFCVDVAIEKQVDFFLIAGDAYKTTNPSPTQQRLFFKALLRLHEANIPVLIVVGNHDNPLSFGKANTLDILSDLPLNSFYVIAKPTAFTLQTKHGPVNIVGIPWPTRNTIAISELHTIKSIAELNQLISTSVRTIIQEYAKQLDPLIPAVLTGHLTVSAGIFSGSEKRAIYGHDPLFLPSDLAIEPFDYVALGHLHRFQQINPDAKPPIIYSGSIERIDFGERKEEKGFCLVTITDKKQCSYEFIKTPQRPFIQIELTLTNDETISHTQQVINAIKRHAIQDAIIKIIYHVKTDIKDTVDLNAVQRACLDAYDIVGIIPVHEPKLRTYRTTMKVDMDIVTLLDTYLSQKNIATAQRTTLIEKALKLKEEIAQEEHETLPK